MYQSARSDLLELENRGYLIRHKVGRRVEFLPAADLPEHLNR